MESVGGVGMDGGMRIGEGEGAWWFGVCILRGRWGAEHRGK